MTTAFVETELRRVRHLCAPVSNGRLATIAITFTGPLILTLIIATFGFGQSASQPDRGVVSTAPYDSSGIENINLQNGNVGLAIPLASLPRIAGGNLSFTVHAYYNSKLYDTYTQQRHIVPPENNEGLRAAGFNVEIPRLSDVGGWRVGGKYQINAVTPTDLFVPDSNLDPTPSTQLIQSYPWSKTYLLSPDGAKHELRPLGAYQPIGEAIPCSPVFIKTIRPLPTPRCAITRWMALIYG